MSSWRWSVMLMVTMKHVTPHEHHILWSPPLSVLSHGACTCTIFLYCIFVFLYCIFVFVRCIVFLYLYITLSGVSHKCICGNNQNQMDFLNPMRVALAVVIGIKLIIMSMFVSMSIMTMTIGYIIFWRYNYIQNMLAVMIIFIWLGCVIWLIGNRFNFLLEISIWYLDNDSAAAAAAAASVVLRQKAQFDQDNH